MTENDSSNWLFDYGLIENIPVPGGDLPSIDPPGGPIWSSSHSFTDTATLSLEFDQPFGNQNDLTGDESRKRARPTTSYATSSKACREKIRRNKLNDKFTELASILDPGRPLKVDKSVILIDAARMVNQLRDEVQKLKESKERLLENIEELKAEKNELRVEKLKLKTDKENLERQVQSLGAPGFLPHPHPPALPVPFSFPGQVGGTKLVPYVGYPGITMWRLMPPAAVDTSQDHALRPPVA